MFTVCCVLIGNIFLVGYITPIGLLFLFSWEFDVFWEFILCSKDRGGEETLQSKLKIIVSLLIY